MKNYFSNEPSLKWREKINDCEKTKYQTNVNKSCPRNYKPSLLSPHSSWFLVKKYHYIDCD